MSGRVRNVLRRVPGASRVYRHSVMLAVIAYEGWCVHRRHFYDSIHARRGWDFEAPSERGRHSRTLRTVEEHRGGTDWGDVVEVGCSDGVFTVELVRRSRSVTAYDISPLACRLAASRCARALPEAVSIQIEQRDVTRKGLGGTYDIVFAMDVLDCLHGRSRIARAVANLVNGLRPGGLLVFSAGYLPEQMQNAWWARWLLEGADNLLPFLAEQPSLHLLHHERYPESGDALPPHTNHVIGIFERSSADDRRG